MSPPPETLLVTGATGLIGAHLCRMALDAGRRVVALVRTAPAPGTLFHQLGLHGPVETVRVNDLDLGSQIAAIAPDAVINLAGQSQIPASFRDPAACFEANTALVWRLLAACAALPRPPVFVQASTDAVYREASRPAREWDVPHPASPYAASKIAAELAVQAYRHSHEMPAVIARLGNVYGPGDRNEMRLIPMAMRELRAGRYPQLRSPGQIRGYLHVEDTAAGLLLLADNATNPGVSGEVFNLASDEGHAASDVVALASAALGTPLPQPVTPDAGAPADDTVRMSSTRKIRQALGWRARVSLAEGLKTLVPAKEPVA